MRAAVLLLVLAVASSSGAKPRSRLVRYPSWNSRMYPVWKDGDPRYQDSWRGGRVIFNVANDSPTLTGAKVTFTIDLEFPHNQKVLPNGAVVWAADAIVNGTSYGALEPVFPPQDPDWEAVFPDGTPMKKDKAPNYVFVWKAWGQYWQVADDSSSSLTIATDDVPLGSYTMDVVIYHYRSREKFIPLGYASTQFSITDQIPFSVSLDQVNDIVAGDMRFILNRAISFTVTLHDPSEFLSDADITFNWDFGDGSGALISRELTVTHTYVNTGSFKPKVVVQALIPDKACDVPANTTKAPNAPSDGGSTDKAPAAVSAGPKLVSTKTTGVNVKADPSEAEEDNSEDEVSTTLPGRESPTLAQAPPAISRDTSAGQATPALVAKRDVSDKPSNDDCVIYRYGSFCTGIEVFEAIEKVEIVQMDNAVTRSSEMDGNVLDITVTCQGSLPKEVCSVILDAECMRPIHTECNMVEPSRECQLVLRHFFNGSGIYCINVSMANDVSLASTSTKVNFDMGSGLTSPRTIAMVIGVLVLVFIIGAVAYSYKRFKSYQALEEDVMISANLQSSRPNVCSGASMVWKLLNRRGAVDDCPLLQDRPV